MRTKGLLLSACLWFVLCSVHARNINFDTEFWNANSSLSKSALQTSLTNFFNNTVADGDAIYFNSASYDFKATNISITKNGVSLFGASVNANYNANTRGATGITTQFTEVNTMVLRGNNITIKRLDIASTASASILIDMRAPDYLDGDPTTVTQYTNLTMTNVELRNALYLVHAGNGVSGTITKVSFTNFRNIAFWFDRKGETRQHGKMTWDKCVFSPDTNPATYGFNDRGISFDAGNEEYPYLWDHSGSLITDCEFINTGIGASSRGEDVEIRDNVFNDNTGKVQLIHIEEFSRNFVINGNTFNCTNSEIIGLDRELQRVQNISVENNTVNGTFIFFISAYAPRDLKIRSNTFASGATASGNTINLTFYENQSYEPYGPALDYVSEDIDIRWNSNLRNTKGGSPVIIVRSETGSSITTDVPAAYVTETFGTAPLASVPNGTYYIQNSEGKLRDWTFQDVNMGPSSNTGTDVRWEIQWIYPFFYTIKNSFSQQYLEALEVYNESHICYGATGSFEPHATETYGASTSTDPVAFWNDPRPFWVLVRNSGTTDWLLIPGGNERQSTLSSNGSGNPTLITRKEDGDPADSVACPRGLRDMTAIGNTRWAWDLINVSTGVSLRQGQTTSIANQDKKDLLMFYPNPAKKIVNVVLRDSDSLLQPLQFYDVHGRMVMETALAVGVPQQVNVSGLTPGVYLMKVDGIGKRIVIQ